METIKVRVDGINIRAPRYPNPFLQAIPGSKYLECNHTRANQFYAKYGRETDEKALAFRQNAKDLLSQAKKTLDELGIQFWLSSGTCLGKSPLTHLNICRICTHDTSMLVIFNSTPVYWMYTCIHKPLAVYRLNMLKGVVRNCIFHVHVNLYLTVNEIPAGWFRQCDIIPYSQDVDLGIWIKDYDVRLIPAMRMSGMPLKHLLGKVGL